MSTEFELPELKQAIGRLDDLFATAFSSKDNAMQDWVAVRSAIKAQSAPSNSDYTKCTNEVLKYVTDNICDEGITKKVIKNILKKHFA